MAQIIPKKLVSVESNWQKELAFAFTDPEKLLRYLSLDPLDYQADIAARRLFPLRVPRHFATLMRAGDPADPLLLQVLPLQQEFQVSPDYSFDPLNEQSNPTPGLLHKYRSRVLLIVRGGCAVNCRYCFRRHFPYGDNSPSHREWQSVITQISADSNINEVIFSGGDPLMAKDHHLADLAQQVSAIPHIKRLRIHTRLPVVLPDRIDDSFIQWFGTLPLQRLMVLHINHPNEISPELEHRLSLLADAGVTLLNQAVLLKGVNDSADTLTSLSEKLFAARILPYYLHMMDKVQGAAHFDVDAKTAKQIMHELSARLPGFLVPKLVREIGGKTSKSLIDLGMAEQ
ncbi:EF-P beta-lysylation protein EpmB [Alteromonas flava]|uniref:EF-P beta-lysylation protein EpmB n=1 Tax=Alteromonas flava TaxID=2048003 RepID=UPI000C28A4D0|nr:EF-P beta-lysylation protein EpmB [Alteromonas flava]